METLQKTCTLEGLLEELTELQGKEKGLLKQKSILEGEIVLSQSEIKNLTEETETEYIEADGVVLKIQKRSQQETTRLGLKTKESGGVAEDFYSKGDKMSHQATGWHSYYFYDEESKAHSQDKVHKIIATSDPEKYPSVALLTVQDLLKKSK